jgi:hypothetical protein
MHPTDVSWHIPNAMSFDSDQAKKHTETTATMEAAMRSPPA